MAATSTVVPWIEYSDSMCCIPSLAYRLVFAQLVWMACEKGQFKTIAVELPPRLKEEGFIEQMLRLSPAVGIIRNEEENVSVPFSPNDALLMAIRCAKRYRIPIEYVDWDFQKDYKRKPEIIEYFDDYLAIQKGIKYAYDIFGERLEFKPDARKIWQIVSNLIRIMGATEKCPVLFVCNASSWKAIKDGLDRPLGVIPPEELGSGRGALSVILGDINKMWEWGFLDDIADVAWQFEESYTIGQSACEFDKGKAIDNLICSTLRSSLLRRDRNARIENVRLLRRFLAAKCLIGRRLQPSLEAIFDSACACAGERFGQVLLARAMHYPEVKVLPSPPSSYVRGEKADDRQERRALEALATELIGLSGQGAEDANSDDVSDRHKVLARMRVLLQNYLSGNESDDAEVTYVDDLLSLARMVAAYESDRESAISELYEVLLWRLERIRGDLGRNQDYQHVTTQRLADIMGVDNEHTSGSQLRDKMYVPRKHEIEDREWFGSVPADNADKPLYGAPSEAKLIKGLSTQAKKFLSLDQKKCIIEQFSGSLHLGLDVRYTMRARVAYPFAIYVKRKLSMVKREDDVCPVVYIFDYDCPATSRRVLWTGSTDKTIIHAWWCSSNGFNDKKRLWRESLLSLVDFYPDFVSPGWGVSFPKGFPEDRRVKQQDMDNFLDPLRSGDPESMRGIMLDARYSHVDEAICLAARYTSKCIIVVSEPCMALLPDVELYASQKNVRIYRIPIGKMPQRSIQRVQMLHSFYELDANNNVPSIET